MPKPTRTKKARRARRPLKVGELANYLLTEAEREITKPDKPTREQLSLIMTESAGNSASTGTTASSGEATLSGKTAPAGKQAPRESNRAAAKPAKKQASSKSRVQTRQKQGKP